VWVVGFGTVGRWLLNALDAHRERLADRYGIGLSVVGLASARGGFVHAENGLDVPAVLRMAALGRPLAQLPGVSHWPSAIEGLRATEADVLVEVTSSRPTDGEPGLAHMREALRRGIPVVTSNKWPVALAGVELAALARDRGTSFRAESTVMSGTPVLAALVEGLAGAIPIGLRGVLNATANLILSRMMVGASYQDALREAQLAGLTEADPTADVGGADSVAKLMILAGLVFGRQLRLRDVACRGITDLTQEEIDQAAASGDRIRHLATLRFSESDGAGSVDARVEPTLVRPGDPLATVEGTGNAVVCTMRPVGDVTITGPGAGPDLAGQGVLSDLIVTALRGAATAG
jgi:homoserine dehydrogenase